MRPSLEATFRCFLVALGLSIFPAISSGEVLVVSPICGTPGSSFQITGSGWAEPEPPCEYVFYFDGVEFAPRQPDGLFGPPNQTATVPAAAMPGDHTVKVELRISADQTLVGCWQTMFKVVSSANKDPWAGGNNITQIAGNNVQAGIDATKAFDPTDVCDVTPCKKLFTIQVVRQRGQQTDLTIRALTFAEQKFLEKDVATLDADVTSAGYTIDYVTNQMSNPYYPFCNSGGEQSSTPKPAGMCDGPTRYDSTYPKGVATDHHDDIVNIMLDFEVAVFCEQGDNKGEFVGTFTWHWQRPLGGPPVVTVDPPTRNTPSGTFVDALNLWIQNHPPFKLPTSTQPKTGGMKCN